jgi:hypothetical protein
MEGVPEPTGSQAASFTSFKASVKGLVAIVLGPGLALLFGGTWSWPEVWIYALIHFLTTFPILVYLRKHNPGLLEERARFLKNPGTKTWDKYFVGAYLGSYPLEFVAAGLDKRFSASWWRHMQLYPFTKSSIWTGFGLVLVGYGLVTWAMCVNR